MFKIYAVECKWCKRLFASFPLLVTRRDLNKMENRIMVKLSEVEGKVKAQNDLLTQIAADVKVLKDNAPIPTDPPIPAGAEAELATLETKVKDIRTVLDTPTPPTV